MLFLHSLFFFYISTLITVDWLLVIYFVKFPQWPKVLQKRCQFLHFSPVVLQLSRSIQMSLHGFITCSSLWALSGEILLNYESWIPISTIKFISGNNRDNSGHALAEYYDVPIILIIFKYFSWIFSCLAFLYCS